MQGPVARERFCQQMAWQNSRPPTWLELLILEGFIQNGPFVNDIFILESGGASELWWR